MFFEKEEDIFVSQDNAVLLLEDNKMTRKITAEMLQYLGYTVEAVARGEEAVHVYRQWKEEGRPFKAVILDLCQPEGPGGEETLRQLMEYDPDVKAVASSGFTGSEAMINFRASGFRAPLPKPYGIRQLGSVLRAVIGFGEVKKDLKNIRKDLRHGIIANFEFIVGGRADVCEGVTFNISQHGFGFLTEAVFTQGQSITVTKHDLPNMAGCKARVVWVREGARHSRAGAQFVTAG